MGRTKGRKNKVWSKEQKYQIILPIISGEKSSWDMCRELNVPHTNIVSWIKKYQAGGIEALENKRKPGNPLAKYINRKELSYTEQLEYENMKLRIENERFKKGYTSKEADLAKQKR